jgi:glycosyltransferase involved in cell wall biosynthesis
MKISVILCTYNRCDSLAKALASVAVSELPDNIDWEVLVVDNNSRDQTRQVAQDFCGRNRHIRYLFESKQGKSNALNLAIRESRGDVLAFMDDDVTVEPDWLRNLTTPLQSGPWSGVGGRILPPKDFSAPPWLTLEGPYKMGGILALFDRGSDPADLDVPPFGTNMAFRKIMFDKFGGFRTDLGAPPGNTVRGEDTEFCQRLLNAGERIRYEPSAIVHHAVPPERLTEKYFLSWWFVYGRACVRLKEMPPNIWGIPRRPISIANRLLNLLPWRVYWWWSESDVQQRFYKKCLAWMMAGEIAEIFHGGSDSRKLPSMQMKHERF